MLAERLESLTKPQEHGVSRGAERTSLVRPCVHSLEGVVCNHFYELILSTGCPFHCRYCYLQSLNGGDHNPVIFTNQWPEVERQLDQIAAGVFSTGEWADSLATHPPLLQPAIAYFRRQQEKFLFLTTKSDDVELLLEMEPTRQVWVSFSINAVAAWERFESHTPHPYQRLAVARALQEVGWRVRVRIDPIIAEVGIEHYRDIAQKVSRLAPERITVGTLRKLPGLFPEGSTVKHHTSPSGVRFYQEAMRAEIYRQMADWLGFQPALCRETYKLWERLGWGPIACNCTA